MLCNNEKTLFSKNIIFTSIGNDESFITKATTTLQEKTSNNSNWTN